MQQTHEFLRHLPEDRMALRVRQDRGNPLKSELEDHLLRCLAARMDRHLDPGFGQHLPQFPHRRPDARRAVHFALADAAVAKQVGGGHDGGQAVRLGQSGHFQGRDPIFRAVIQTWQDMDMKINHLTRSLSFVKAVLRKPITLRLCPYQWS